MADVVAPPDLRQSFPSIAPSGRFRNLMLRQLWLSPKLYTSRAFDEKAESIVEHESDSTFPLVQRGQS